jgi:hypothetical protein
MTDTESRPAKLRGRAVRAGACCAALAAVAMLTASCAATTAAAGALKSTVPARDTGGQTASDAASQLCNGRHASRIKLRRLVVTLHAAIRANAAGRPAGPWTVTSPAKMRRVQVALCALPAPRTGVYNCPADLGISYRLQFSAAHGALPVITADVTGCQMVTGLGNTARWAAESPGFWPTLARATGLDPAA